MITINIWIQSLNRLILFLFVTFISFYAASDDAASENVEIEVIEIIGSQEEALEIAGSASVITTEDLKLYEYTDIHKILSTVPGINFRPEEGYGL
ncbi:MAG: TonB-dependent receptor, partial [SAR86 cluster bacterium]|nr:TonB-dependent receptor [SAR86 cluster bacterium]